MEVVCTLADILVEKGMSRRQLLIQNGMLSFPSIGFLSINTAIF